MRIAFTGGAGKAGRHAVRHLLAQGHKVTNWDLRRCEVEGADDLIVDLTDSGQVANAMVAWGSGAEMDAGAPRPYDAVVHFAAVPSLMLKPDNETYRVNVLSTYNVLDAALRAGVRKVVIASSETTYGVCFAAGEVKPLYIPVDEEHPTVPHDSYAMSKVVNEATARSFQARSGADIYALRINNVIEPHEYADLAPRWRDDPACRRRNIFAYIDARDLGAMVEACLRAEGLGYQVFNVSNPDSSVGPPSAEIAERFYAGVERRGPIEGHATFYSSAKAKRLLGWEAPSRWRDG